MSIDAQIAALTAALEANTKALERLASAGGSASKTTAEATTGEAATQTKTRTKAAPKEEAPKVTQEQMQAALIKIKDAFGMEHAKVVIKEAGGVEKMGDIKPSKYAEVLDAAVKKFDELSGAGDDEGGDDGL